MRSWLSSPACLGCTFTRLNQRLHKAMSVLKVFFWLADDCLLPKPHHTRILSFWIGIPVMWETHPGGLFTVKNQSLIVKLLCPICQCFKPAPKRLSASLFIYLQPFSLSSLPKMKTCHRASPSTYPTPRREIRRKRGAGRLTASRGGLRVSVTAYSRVWA